MFEKSGSISFEKNDGKCPFCKANIDPDALKCLHCGEWINPGSNRAKVATGTKHSSALSHRDSGKLTRGVALFSLIVVIIVVIASQAGSNSSTTTPAQQQAQNAQRAAVQAAAKQSVVNNLGLAYCASHKSIRMQKIDQMVNEGFPMFNGTGSFSAADCTTIISKLYDLDPKTADLQNVVGSKFWVGMRIELLIYSVGTPNDANTTTTAFGNSAQWVYGDPINGANYVYIDNGVVTSYQLH
ncbi:MAG: hypothetical protein ACHQUB_03765 [Candidatus Saccharimonadia bacterium]